jgi:endonuclease YncB( thermonuclease family)
MMKISRLKGLTVSVAAALFACSVHAATLKGRVTNVIDGDTMTVLDAKRQTYRVRLLGVDAPESAQPYGSDAKKTLAGQIMEKEVVVEWRKRDRDGALRGKVLYRPATDPACAPDCAKGTEIDAAYRLLENGHAWHDAPNVQEQSREDGRAYAAAEQTAKAGKVGLWADDGAIAPWQWRMKQKAPAPKAPARRTVKPAPRAPAR